MRICSLTIAPAHGQTDDATKTAADLVDKALVIPHQNPITDFSKARNRALRIAADEGFDWALMLDTDERIQWPTYHETDATLGELLSLTDADVLMVPHVSGTYEKERLFRLPARGQYVGPVHEAFIVADGARRDTLTGLVFSEEAKTPEALAAKLERDLRALEDWTTEHPEDPRWFYYLGDTYANLGRAEAATQAFAQCWRLGGWDEESAWACYRNAELCVREENWIHAIEWCQRGMERRPDFPEFPWLIGWCCYQQGRDEKAILWERLAVTLNEANFWPRPVRIGFRHPPAHFEGPWDVMAHAATRADNATVARTMRSMATKRQTQREQGKDSPALE